MTQQLLMTQTLCPLVRCERNRCGQLRKLARDLRSCSSLPTPPPNACSVACARCCAMLARPCVAPALGARRVALAPLRCAAPLRPQRRPAARCRASAGASESVEEVLQYEFGVVNKTTRKALLLERSIASATAAELRFQLDALRTLLAVSAADFECCLCVCKPYETGALLELGRSEVAARMAIVRAALPPGVDAGKIVAAAPFLLLQDEPGERVSASLELIRGLGADPTALANERPGSFGNWLAKVCRTGDGDFEKLEPLLRAWAMDRKGA